MTEVNLFSPHPDQLPTLLRRYISTLLDFLIVGSVLILIMLGFEGLPEYQSLKIILIFLIILSYEPLLVSYRCTIGQYFLGIRVQSYYAEGKRIALIESLARYAVKVMLGWISFLIIHTNPEKRAIHDMAGNSVMVRIK